MRPGRAGVACPHRAASPRGRFATARCRRDPRERTSSGRSTPRCRSPRAGDRRRPHRRRRRRPRDGARDARRRSTSAAAASSPRFTDSHVHFPTWALAQRQVKLDGCASLEEALARVRDAEREPGALAARLRLAGRRLAERARADEGGARRGHGRDAGDPDLEGLPLAVAQLGGARRAPAATSRCTAASSSGTSAASRRASSARSPRGGSASATSSTTRGRVGRGDARAG